MVETRQEVQQYFEPICDPGTRRGLDIATVGLITARVVRIVHGKQLCRAGGCGPHVSLFAQGESPRGKAAIGCDVHRISGPRHHVHERQGRRRFVHVDPHTTGLA